jgi:hypothetical protein
VRSSNDRERALMVSRVMTAHKRVKKLEEELIVIADGVHGTGLWVPAYERVMDARNTRIWLAGYLDALRQA